MARTTAANFSGVLAFPYATAGTDLFKKEDVQTLAQAVDQHDHTPGKGLALNTAPADASITNAKLGPDVARANLLANGGLEIWQRGNGPFTGSNFAADRWGGAIVGSDTLSVSKDTANVDTGSTAAAACVFTLGSGGGSTSFYQSLKTADCNLRGKTLSISIRLRTATANAVRAYVQCDGTGGATVTSSFHAGSGAYATLTVTSGTIPIDATSVVVGVYFAASSTAYIDNAMLVVGSQYADYVPMHPADDLARCLRYYEKHGGTVAADLYYSAYQSAGFAAGLTTHFGTKKAVTPTMTKVGTWSVTNCGQPVLDTPAVHGYRMYAITTALGSMSYAVADATTYVTAEANP